MKKSPDYCFNDLGNTEYISYVKTSDRQIDIITCLTNDSMFIIICNFDIFINKNVVGF